VRSKRHSTTCLGTRAGVAGVYNRATYRDEKREGLAQRGDWIEEDYKLNDEVLNHSPLIISETTLKEIMDNSDVIAPERLPETLERLNTLYALAVFYIRTSSRKVRTDFNKGISDLQRDIKQLSNSLDVHRWMFEPMRLAVLDDWFREKSQNADSALGTIKKPNNPLNNLADVHEPLEELANSLARLENMAQHYDRLNDGWDLLNWVRANGLGTAQIVRAELSSYFA
jgi:hypothetical protein